MFSAAFAQIILGSLIFLRRNDRWKLCDEKNKNFYGDLEKGSDFMDAVSGLGNTALSSKLAEVCMKEHCHPAKTPYEKYSFTKKTNNCTEQK